MNPALLLAILLGMTLVAMIANGIINRRRRRAIRQLATDWRMNFGAFDTLGLTARVGRHFPIPGIAALRVVNVIYGIDGDTYRYLFTAEYSVGLIEGNKRQKRVASFTEPRDRRRRGETSLLLAEENLLARSSRCQNRHPERSEGPRDGRTVSSRISLATTLAG